MTDKKIQRVFVYGTLKKGFYFHESYLGGEKSNYCGKATASPDYSLYIDGMPHLVRESTDIPVKGELYEVNEEVLASLDRLEGHPIVYKREMIEVTDEEGNAKLAWAYLRPLHFKGRSAAYKDSEYT